MPASPRVVIAAPLFGKADFLPATLDSLLAQTFEDFAVLLIDDRSPDATVEVAQAYAARDPRIHVEVNPERLGMLDNTRKALWRARERFPEAEYWALGSDHDLWAPRFLEVLVGLLDAEPRAVLAYSGVVRIDEHGVPYKSSKPPKVLDTRHVADPWRRIAVTFRDMAAGSMIYGLFRARALDGLGHYRPVLVPDRLLLTELAFRAPFVATPEVLWQRRFRGLAELERQRRAFFPEGPPRYSRLPWWAQHTGAIVLAYVVRDEGAAAGIDRATGAKLAVAYLGLSLAHRYRRRKARALRDLAHRRRRALRAVRRLVWFVPLSRDDARRARNRMLARYGPGLGAAARRALGRLEAHEATRPLATRTLAPGFERLARRAQGTNGAAARVPAEPQETPTAT